MIRRKIALGKMSLVHAPKPGVRRRNETSKVPSARTMRPVRSSALAESARIDPFAVDPGIARYFIENEHRLYGPAFLAFMREARDWFAARARRKTDIPRRASEEHGAPSMRTSAVSPASVRLSHGDLCRAEALRARATATMVQSGVGLVRRLFARGPSPSDDAIHPQSSGSQPAGFTGASIGGSCVDDLSVSDRALRQATQLRAEMIRSAVAAVAAKIG